MEVAVGLVGLWCSSASAIVWGAEAFAEHLAVRRCGSGQRLRHGAAAGRRRTGGAGDGGDRAAARHAGDRARRDVIGANVAICLVAIGVGAVMTTSSPSGGGPRQGVAGLLLGDRRGARGTDGRARRGRCRPSRIVFVAMIWVIERRPPALGETVELDEAAEHPAGRIGRELAMVLTGVAAMAVGATSSSSRACRCPASKRRRRRLGLMIVVVGTVLRAGRLAWSSARQVITEAVVAAVVGSFAHNATMTLGPSVLAWPPRIGDATSLHLPWVAMIAALVAVVAAPRPEGVDGPSKASPCWRHTRLPIGSAPSRGLEICGGRSFVVPCHIERSAGVFMPLNTTGGLPMSDAQVPKAEMTGLYGYLMKRFSKKLFGDVAEPAAVLAIRN